MGKLRKLERRVTDAFLKVSDRSSGKSFGHLIDLTIEGLKIRSETAMEVNSIFQFRLDLPPDMTRSSTITFDVKCVWTEECEDGEGYFSGFMMHFVSQKDLEKIERIIESPIFRHANKRVSVSLNKRIS